MSTRYRERAGLRVHWHGDDRDPPRARPAHPDRRDRGRDPAASSAIATRRPAACTRWSATTSASTAAARPASGCGRCSDCSPTPRSPATYEPALPGAAAVELGHNFSLIHDDIEDADVERRHRPTLWALHGIPQAINTGDAVFVLSRIALHRLTELGFSDHKVLRLMRLYDETCLALCEGQYIDIWTSGHDDPMTVELYFDMIGRKTAALISAAIEAGALLATDDEAVIARYRAFGWALGLAFQLNDDLLGIWGERGGHRQGRLGHRQAQEDPAGPVRLRAGRAGRSGPPRRGLPRPDADRRRDRRGRRDPRADRRPGLHPRPGPPLSRRGAGRARCRRRRPPGPRASARGDHRSG